MSAPYIKTLDKDRLEVYKKLYAFSDKFILAGGTAIMLQINHRKSYDFDCFSNVPLNKKLLLKVRQTFGDDINVQVDNSDLFLFITSNGVKIDFVYFPYTPTTGVIKSKPISMFALEDLASNKAYVIGRRATWRDYVDIFFLIKKFTLDSIIKNSQKKFKGEFSEKLFLEQLVYFDDLEIVPIDFLQRTYTSEEIMEDLQTAVHKYTSLKISKKLTK
ncbi:MAG: hypothetical protein UT24_C0008G0090 [Candidatus Woesebacteria bacterium GW2011_GWB1_39_12]|uniref:Nucleotidyl transferase AbiEii/AbiGii toxin family protein n=2 Tax=Candidatus Woeseibacteriota TaxID=1752722 RepID=A0A0G0LZN9_9BACT|nr:MAG: hypothetical protein UT23_C0012G0008 [Candidatus Woesebacteria bacterium GW2011_GWA1_39_12]KKR00962.1 MAG: hypothetical protein UT24_C0008G0090 [Candidatus Woesebacteria bacterium GW2011_GWB1_39_12]